MAPIPQLSSYFAYNELFLTELTHAMEQPHIKTPALPHKMMSPHSSKRITSLCLAGFLLYKSPPFKLSLKLLFKKNF